MVSYNKLWHLLIDRKMRKCELMQVAGIAPATLAKLSHDEDVTTATLTKICVALHCNIGDIMEVKEVESLNA